MQSNSVKTHFSAFTHADTNQPHMLTILLLREDENIIKVYKHKKTVIRIVNRPWRTAEAFDILKTMIRDPTLTVQNEWKNRSGLVL